MLGRHSVIKGEYPRARGLAKAPGEMPVIAERADGISAAVQEEHLRAGPRFAHCYRTGGQSLEAEIARLCPARRPRHEQFHALEALPHDLDRFVAIAALDEDAQAQPDRVSTQADGLG